MHQEDQNMEMRKIMKMPEGNRLQAEPLAIQNESGSRMENISELYEQEMLRMMSFPWFLMG